MKFALRKRGLPEDCINIFETVGVVVIRFRIQYWKHLRKKYLGKFTIAGMRMVKCTAGPGNTKL